MKKILFKVTSTIIEIKTKTINNMITMMNINHIKWPKNIKAHMLVVLLGLFFSVNTSYAANNTIAGPVLSVSSSSVCGSTSVTFTVSGLMSFNEGTIKYYRSGVLVKTVSFANTSSLSTNITINGTYTWWATVTYLVGNPSSTNKKTITYNSAPSAGYLSPSSTTICKGSSVSLNLSGNTGSIQKWQYSEEQNWGGNGEPLIWTNITSTSNPIIKSPTVNTKYRAVTYTAACGVTKYTSAAVVYLDPSSVAGSISAISNRCGTGTENFTLSGYTGTILSWQSRYKNGTGSYTSWSTFQETDNQNSVNKSISQWSGGQRTWQIRAVVKSGVCNTVYATKTVTVDQVTVAGSISAISNRCGTGTVNFTLSGHTGTILRWQSRYKNGTGSYTGWSTFQETDNVTSVSPSLSQWNSGKRTYEIRAVVKSGSCTTLYPTKTTTVDPATVAGTISGVSNRCGTGSTSFSLSGNTGTILRWQSRYKNGTGSYTGWSTFQETDNVTSVSPSLSQWNSGQRTYQVRAVVKSGSCSTLYPTKTTTVDPVTVAGSLSGPSSQCGTGSAGFSISGHTGTILRWQSRYKNGTGSYTGWSTFQETDNVTSVSPSLSQWNSGQRSYQVRAIVKSGSCSTLYPTKTVTIDPVTVGGTLSGGTEAYGTSSGTIALNSETGLVQKWQKRENGGSWQDISNTSNTLDFINITTSTDFQSVVQSGVCSTETSTIASVAIYNVPSITINGPDNIGPGGSTEIYTDNGFYSYQWKRDGTVISGAINNTLTVTKPGDYSLTAEAVNGGPTYSTGIYTIGSAIDNQSDLNYITSINYYKAGVQGTTDVFDLGVEDYVLSTKYIDGLGRPMQKVTVGLSPLGHDIVQPIVYDEFGREQNQYLPYVTQEVKGTYRVGAIDPDIYTNSSQYNFYQTATNTAHDAQPFSEKIFEPSPLNRVTEQYGPGQDWRVNSKRTQLSYEISTAADHVISWKVDPSNANQVVKNTPNEYPKGELYKNITIDEEGHQVQEFVNKTGQTILKRVEAPTGWADTYYMYDDFGNLRFVLPPEASKNATASPTIDFLNTWTFQYKYDGRHRMVEKQVPGAGAVYMVYDNRDRLVLTQDANQRDSSVWLFTKYDALNRPVATGFYVNEDSISQSSMQNYVNSVVGNSPYEWYETVSTSGDVHGYNNASFPNVSDTSAYLTVTYYNTYTVPGTWSGFGYQNASLSATTNDTYTTPSSANLYVKGQVTGSKVKKMADNSWLKTATYYDDKYRVIQTVAQNHLGTDAIDRTSSLYDFVGKVLKTKTTHSDGTNAYETTERFEYDHAGRLLKTYYQLNGGNEVLLISNSYNEIGELIEKELHSEDGGSSFAQSLDYRYNIRGWLTSINDPTLSDGEGDYFGMQLMYNDAPEGTLGNAPLYDGNISAVKWTSGITGSQEQAYTYAYDPMSRLVTANSKKNTGSWVAGDFSVAIGNGQDGYDGNGNIQKLTRNTVQSTVMDNLAYTYTGNQLQKVDDASGKPEGFKDGVNLTEEYIYDGNGNMVEDKNKGIASISYNHLNLPVKVIMDTGDSLVNAYDANGIKLSQKIYTSGSLTTQRDYVGDFYYEDDTLRFINNAEGRTVMDGTTPEMQYFLQDHQGNTRIVFTTQDKTDTYLATLETENIGVGTEDLFSGLDATRATSTAANHTAGGNEAAELDDTKPVGPGIIIPVYPGDTLDLDVWGYFEGGNGYNTSTPFGMAANIANSFGGVNGGTGEAGAIYNGLTSALAALGFGGTNDDSRPAAYLNYIVLDENYAYANDNAFGYVQIPASASFSQQQMSIPGVLIDKVGYIFVYVSYESQVHNRVYFDDLQITHHQSRIVQNNMMYPFGLQTASSYQRATALENRWKFQGQEHIAALGLNWDSFKWRNHQPDIGRFFNIDPLSEDYYYNSPYAFSENRVIDGIELEGLEWKSIKSIENKTVVNTVTLKFRNISSSSNSEAIGLAFDIASQAEKSLSGVDSEGFTNTTIVVFDFDSEVQDGDFFMEVRDDIELPSGKTSVHYNGSTELDGNTQVNRVQVNIDKDRPDAIRSGAHEIAHTGGASHPQEKASEAGKDKNGNSLSNNNLMIQGANGTKVTPEQRTYITDKVLKEQ